MPGKRISVAVIRGTRSYKKSLKLKIKNIEKSTGLKLPMEHLIEKGINLVLEEYGEKPISGRLGKCEKSS